MKLGFYLDKYINIKCKMHWYEIWYNLGLSFTSFTCAKVSHSKRESMLKSLSLNRAFKPVSESWYQDPYQNHKIYSNLPYPYIFIDAHTLYIRFLTFHFIFKNSFIFIFFIFYLFNCVILASFCCYGRKLDLKVYKTSKLISHYVGISRVQDQVTSLFRFQL